MTGARETGIRGWWGKARQGRRGRETIVLQVFHHSCLVFYGHTDSDERVGRPNPTQHLYIWNTKKHKMSKKRFTVFSYVHFFSYEAE